MPHFRLKPLVTSNALGGEWTILIMNAPALTHGKLLSPVLFLHILLVYSSIVTLTPCQVSCISPLEHCPKESLCSPITFLHIQVQILPLCRSLL